MTVFPSMFKPRPAPAAVSSTPPAIEVVRQRAKHRLIGASVLVLVGVLVFPVLFDTQPRPIPVDIPIEIPSRQAAKSMGKLTVSPGEVVGTERSLSPREDVLEPAVSSPPPVESVHKPETEPAPSSKRLASEAVSAEPQAKKSVASVPAIPDIQSVPSASIKETARAQALLEGRDMPASGRFVVQVGAFADAAVAQQTRLKLERTGLKTYTHVATTPEGKRTRVRIGPFSSRAEADKAAAKAKSLGVVAVVLTL